MFGFVENINVFDVISKLSHPLGKEVNFVEKHALSAGINQCLVYKQQACMGYTWQYSVSVANFHQVTIWGTIVHDKSKVKAWV